MNSTTMATADATPRPVFRVLTVLCIGVVLLLVLSVPALIYAYSGAATGSDLATQGKHRDCITTIATARNAVFQNVDIYKAIQIDQLSTALLNAQSGMKASEADIKAFGENATLLHASLAEARRVQPADFLDRAIDHGAVIDRVRYPACPG